MQFLLDEVSDDFCVGLGYEFVALRGEFLFESEVVFDDAIVDDDDSTGAVAVRMGVLLSGAAMCGPARVADSVGALERMLADDLLEVLQLAGSAAQREAVPLPPTAMPAES